MFAQVSAQIQNEFFQNSDITVYKKAGGNLYGETEGERTAHNPPFPASTTQWSSTLISHL